MKGRKATPTALKKMRGTDQPVRVNKNEPDIQLIDKLPAAPKWFSLLAKNIYRNKGKELIAQNVMSSVDLDMFLLYCNEYATYIETSEWMRNINLDDKLSESQTERYKRVRQQNQQAWERSKSIAIEFGFTPSARSRVSAISGKEAMSDFEKLMKGL